MENRTLQRKIGSRYMGWGRAVYFMMLFFLFVNSSVVAQVSFVTTANAKQILQNSSVSITIKLNNAKGSKYRPPSFGGLEVIGGPSTSQNMSIINGRSTSSITYNYTLLGSKVGKFTIGPASITANGKNYKTRPIIIEVIKGKTNNLASNSKKKNYVQIEVNDTLAVIGQQLRLDYVLYFQENINNYSIINESEYDGFFALNINTPNNTVQKKIIDGEQYHFKMIKSVVLFPQRTGAFQIDPVLVDISTPIPGKKPRGFFGRVPSKKHRVQTDAVTIIVNNLPEPKPVSFSGAVGKYKMQATLPKLRITTDDAILINMEIRGNGDGKTVSAPLQPEQRNLEYYDPNVIVDKDITDVGFIDNYKKIEYLIVPKKEGNYRIVPQFTYYDTDSNRYEVLESGPFTVQVKKGSRKVTSDDREISVGDQLRGKKQNGSPISSHMLRYKDGVLYGGFLLGLLGLLGIFYRKRQLDIEDNVDPIEKRRRKAQEMATKQLSIAAHHRDSGDYRSFYSEVSLAMNGFLGDKYQIPNIDLDKHKIEKLLRENNVNNEYIEAYLGILQKCEMALFAGQPLKGMNEVYKDSISLIQELAMDE